MPKFKFWNSSALQLAAALGLFFLATSLAYAAAGRVQFVAGDVKVQNNKQVERIPKKGDNIDSGDTIVTTGTGSLQLVMADGGLLAVRPNTQLRIDDYVFTGKDKDKNNKSFFSLFKGTFRSITGAIGKNNKDAYKVTTSTATMGIRGTDHEPAVILPPPPGFPPLPPDAPQPGTYDRVNSGQTFIQTPFGLVTLNANQVGFAPAGGGAPVILPKVPSFYSSAPKPAPAKKLASSGGGTQSGGSSTSSTSSGTSTTSGGTTDSSSGTTTTTSTDSGTSSTLISTSTSTTSTSTILSTNTAITTSSTITSVTGTTLPTTTTTVFQPPGSAPIGSGAVGANINLGPMMATDSAGSILVTAPSPTQEIILGPQYELLYIFDGLSSPTFEFDSFMSALSNQGSFTYSDGSRVDWGRWAPGYLVFDNGTPVSSIGDFHYAVSTNITPLGAISLTGAVSYNNIGGTSPTDLNGMPASLNIISLGVDFSAQTVDLSINVTANSIPLGAAAMGAPLADFVAPNVGITGSGTNGEVLKAYGQLVGSNAEGAIVSYDIRDMTGTNGAIGVSVFAR